MVITNYENDQYYAPIDEYEGGVIQDIIDDYGLEKEFENIYDINIDDIDETWIEQLYAKWDSISFDSDNRLTNSFLEYILYPVFKNLETKYIMFDVYGKHCKFFVIVEINNEL